MAGKVVGLVPGQSVFLSLKMKCPAGFIPDADGQCVHCSLGAEPNPDQTGCLKCSLRATSTLQTWHSSDGAMCTLCPAGRAANDARSACEPCTGNTHNVGDGRACMACATGVEPDANHSSCVSCAEISYSIVGECLKCELSPLSPAISLGRQLTSPVSRLL